MMCQGRHIKFILVLVLGLGTSAGSIQPLGENGDRNIQISQVTFTRDNDPQELTRSWDELKTAYDEYKITLFHFFVRLEEVVRNQRSPKYVNSKAVYEKLQAVRYDGKNLYQKLQTSNSQYTREISKVSDEINATIDDIYKVINPLRNGVEDEDAVKKVQKYLNFFDSYRFNDNLYGKFGPTTQKEIYVYLIYKSEQLEVKLDRLGKIIGDRTQTFVTQESIENLTRIVEENQRLKAQVEELALQISQLPNKKGSLGTSTVIIIVTIGIGIGAIAFFFNKLFVKIQQVDAKILSRGGQPIDAKISSIETRLQAIEPYSISSKTYPVVDRKMQTLVDQSLDSPIAQDSIITFYDKLVLQYNHNAQELLERATVVSETEESMNQRSRGSSQKAIFEQSNRGNYWMIKEEDCEYLVPKADIKINQYNYRTVEALFLCSGYRAGESSNFKLLKPAEVSGDARIETKQWQLVEKGVLEFKLIE